MSGGSVICRQLHKAYGATPVVVDFSFTVEPGQIAALLGPSGCGKTTTLRLIAGFESLDRGRIVIDNQVVADEDVAVAPEKRRVGMVFQDYAIFPHLSVADNVAFGLGRRRDAPARVEALLAFVGLAGSGKKMPHELSGGQQQRVALARALAPEPAVLLLDEPFSNLDAALRTEVRHEVRALLRESKTTAIFVTHDQEEALFMGDQVAVMNNGRLAQIGSPEAVFHQPRSRFVADFVGQTDFIPGTAAEQGVVTALGLLRVPVNVSSGTPVEAGVRADDVRLRAPEEAGAEANARVVDRQFTGIAYIYHIALADGTVVRSWQPHTLNFPVGAPLVADIRPGHSVPLFCEDRLVS